MTAIYAFNSKKERFGLLFADDLEGLSGKRVDKIYYLNKRFAIALYGSDILQNVIYEFHIFEKFSNYRFPDTVELLVKHLSESFFTFCETHYPSYEEAILSGRLPKENQKTLLANTQDCVILDCKANEIYDVNFGHPIPPSRLKKHPSISKLESEVLHRFALASYISPNQSKYKNLDIYQKPIQFCESLIKVERKVIEQIGGLGSIFLMRKKRIDFISCIHTPLDLLKERQDTQYE